MKLLFYVFLVLGIVGMLLGFTGHVLEWFIDVPTDAKQYTSLIEIRAMVFLMLAYLINRDFLD